MTLYRIVQGVHRCVAARLVGLVEVQAQIDRGGLLGPVVAVPLDAVYSPKSSIRRWDRGRDFNVLLQMMADETRRRVLWPVVLAVLPTHRAKYITRIADVVVIP
jgi:hypothetical protein